MSSNKDISREFTRRDFLKSGLEGAVAAGMISGVPIIGGGDAEAYQRARVSPIYAPNTLDYSPSDSTSSPHLIDHLAHLINLEVPRNSDFKWGWNILIQQLRTCGPETNFLVTAQNEPYDPPGDHLDPRRMLTTTMSFENGGISWTVNPTLTYFVDDRNDNHMLLYLDNKKGQGLNNLRLGRPGYSHQQHFPSAAGEGLNPDLLVSAKSVWNEQYETMFMQDQFQMHRNLEGRSDPRSVTTIRPWGPSHQEHGVYDVQVYRVESNGRRGVTLTGQVHWINPDEDSRSSNGSLIREDGRTALGGPYSEITMIYLHPDTKRIVNDYKITTAPEGWAARTNFHRPHLEQWTEPYWGIEPFLRAHRGFGG